MAKVRLNQARIYRVGGIRLLPGINTVSDEQWSVAKANPVVARKIERGDIVEVEAKKSTGAQDVVAEVKETFDMATLREYAKDSRKTVAEAAEKQIAKIDAKAKQDEESQ